MLISYDGAENSLKWYLGFLLMFIKIDKLSLNVKYSLKYIILNLCFLKKIQRYAEK